MPAEIVIERMTDTLFLCRLMKYPIIGRGRIAVENETPGGPDVDEVRLDAKSVSVNQPNAAGKCGRKEDDVGDRDCKRDAFIIPVKRLGSGAIKRCVNLSATEVAQAPPCGE